jgi:hypothetical protein
MNETTAQLVSGGGAVALAVVVWWELKSMRRTLERIVERLARIDVRTAESEAVPEPLGFEHSRSLRRRTPPPTPFMDDDTPTHHQRGRK